MPGGCRVNTQRRTITVMSVIAALIIALVLLFVPTSSSIAAHGNTARALDFNRELTGASSPLLVSPALSPYAGHTSPDTNRFVYPAGDIVPGQPKILSHAA